MSIKVHLSNLIINKDANFRLSGISLQPFVPYIPPPNPIQMAKIQ